MIDIQIKKMMLAELTHYMIDNNVENISIEVQNKNIWFYHFNEEYECAVKHILIFDQMDNDRALIEFERMMKVMKDGELLD